MRAQFKPFLGSGDNGWTDLLGGKRVSKTDLKISINALVDELNCLLGIVKAKGRKQKAAVRGQKANKKCSCRALLCKSERIEKKINEIQKDLILISSSIAGLKANEKIRQAVISLEQKISSISKKLPPAKKFITPGKTQTGSFIHLARSRARIIEILLWKAKLKKQAVYFNRLSDYLFLAARQRYH